MNTRLINALIFLLTGVLGFFSISICYFTLVFMGVIDEGYFEQSRITFESWSAGILIVWFICLLFSFAGIFMDKKERGILFAAPVVVPLVYGFTSLLVAA